MSGELILVVDDEANIRDLARIYLEKEGFKVDTVSNGSQALLQIKQSPPALVVLDLMLPEIDGWEVCRRIRASGDLPIIILTAKDDDIDKILGLELGADDYMTKPFNPRELVARVRAVLRRTSSGLQDSGRRQRRLGDVAIDPLSRDVSIDDKSVSLRIKEFDLLLAFIDNANQVLTREQLLNKVWGYEYYGETRTVDVHVAHLREKLAASSLRIETVWGIGYKLTVQED
jgi:two-component system alkaline phosphatase synthesis response regulator PhoP